jgi:ribosomal protein S18 acetylase RimI-like enzyme
LVTGGPDAGSPAVRPAEPADAAAAARLHVERISEGFLALLGPRFLTLLYQRILSSDGSFLLVADAHDQVAGFVAGSGDVRGLYRAFLLHDGVRASITAAGRLVSGWRRALETLRHGSGDGAGRGRGTELLAIAVDSGHQGTGIGGRLVGAFLDEVVRRGGDSAYVVVASHNLGAVRLYERAGFTRSQEFELHAGASSLLLQWDGPAGASGAGGTP